MSRQCNPSTPIGFKRTAAVVTALPFTFASWARMDSDVSGTVIGLGDSSSADGNWTIQFRAGGEFWAQTDPTDGGAAVQAVSTSSWSADTWYHIGGVYESATPENRIYFNGAQEDTVSTTSKAVTGVDRTGWGLLPRLTDVAVCLGKIALGGIWDTDLLSDEMRALGDGVSPALVRPESLVAFWIGEGLGDEQDRSGQGNVLTELGASTEEDNPPIGPVFGFDSPLTLVAPPVGGAITIPVAMDSYRRRHEMRM